MTLNLHRSRTKEYGIGAVVVYRHTNEVGLVHRTNAQWVFVKFLDDIARLSYNGATAKACLPEQLQYIGSSL